MLLIVKLKVTFTGMCGASVLPCPECHPSCSGCTTPGICDSCAAGVDAASYSNGAACMCVDGKGTKASSYISYHQECVSCPAMCATCYNDIGYNCYTCKVSSAVVVKIENHYGRCDCGVGYAPRPAVTEESQCISCIPAGCPYCIAADENYCFPSEETYFIMMLGASFEVPKTTTTQICYNTPLKFPAGCEQTILEDIMGTLTKDAAGVYEPTKAQCDKMLEALWPTTEHCKWNTTSAKPLEEEDFRESACGMIVQQEGVPRPQEP